jgi:hypothetical protein
MARQLKLQGKVCGNDRTICTLGILDADNKLVSNEASGVKLRDIDDFFKRNISLMPLTVPSDFTIWLATSSEECVSIADHPTLYEELGLHLDPAAGEAEVV